jgi:hypothetical protein
MDNSITTAYGSELSQHLLEAIYKLDHAGATHEGNSIILGLKLEVVQQVVANYHSHASDANYSEQNQFNAHPSMTTECVTISPKKSKISGAGVPSFSSITIHILESASRSLTLSTPSYCSLNPHTKEKSTLVLGL